MNAAARQALRTIRDCAARERFLALRHFTQRMDERRLFWPDVLAALDTAHDVQADGRDRQGRPRWIVKGRAADDLALDLVVALDRDERGAFAVFITLYWR